MWRLSAWIVLWVLLGLPPGVAADQARVFSGVTGPATFQVPSAPWELSAHNWYYHVQRVGILTPTEYGTGCWFEPVAESGGSPYVHLYRDSFDPADPLENLVETSRSGPWSRGANNRDVYADVLSGRYVLVTSHWYPGVRVMTTVRCNGGEVLQGACPRYRSEIPFKQQICLSDRFRVTATWRTATDEGQATPVSMGSGDSALFWFFSSDNWELMVKVLNACVVNGHYWVFIAATTNQAYEVTVVEEGASGTGATRTYANQLGVRSPAFTDTTAFRCP